MMLLYIYTLMLIIAFTACWVTRQRWCFKKKTRQSSTVCTPKRISLMSAPACSCVHAETHRPTSPSNLFMSCHPTGSCYCPLCTLTLCFLICFFFPVWSKTSNPFKSSIKAILCFPKQKWHILCKKLHLIALWCHLFILVLLIFEL